MNMDDDILANQVYPPNNEPSTAIFFVFFGFLVGLSLTAVFLMGGQ